MKRFKWKIDKFGNNLYKEKMKREIEKRKKEAGKRKQREYNQIDLV